MGKLRTTTQFKRDLKKAGKRDKGPDKLLSVVAKLIVGEPLDRINRPRRLVGDWSPCWEYHIEP